MNELPSADESPSVEPILIDSGAITLDALKLRLAAQIAPARWRSTLERMATRIEAGDSLEMLATTTTMPRELECLCKEAMRLPDPTRFILDALRGRSEVRTNWNGLASLIGYPLAMLMFAVLIGTAFSYSARGIVDFSGLEDLGIRGFDYIQANIEDQQHALMGVGMVVIWTALALLTVALAGPPWAWSAIVGGFIIVGRPLRWVSLQEILYRFHLFAEQGVADGSIGRAVARSFSRSSQAMVAESVARRIEAGMPVGRALANSMLSDGLCSPALLLLDEQEAATSANFLRSSRLLGQLAEQRCRVLGMILPVLLLLIVGTIIWATISCYIMVFLPVVSMISALS